MNRMNLLLRLDGLLENCKGCPKHSMQVNPKTKCAACEVYPQIREIGENLGRKKQMAIIALDDYLPLANLTAREAAEKLGVSPKDISNFRFRFKDQINARVGNKQPITAEKKHTETNNTPKKEDTAKAEYERLISALRNDLNTAHNQLEDKDELIRNLQGTIEKYQRVNCSCGDKQKEIDSLREEKNKLQDQCSKLLDKQYNDSYNLENMKNRVAFLADRCERWEKENKAMRELLRLWV
jgi:predicted RNase H-like nuclease (RuvC/YqgF family)